jgi:hypothetical protein
MKPRCNLLSLLILCAGATRLAGDTSDTAGYLTLALPAQATGLLSLHLVEASRHIGFITSVGSDHVEFAEPLDELALGDQGRGSIQVREGTHPGLNLRATGINGRRVLLDRSPAGLILPGDLVDVRPDLTLASVFGAANFAEIQEATNPDAADVVGIWNPESQTSKVYYFKSGAGWREVGNEAAGDQSDTRLPYPAALNFTRRATTPLHIVVSGIVPMPLAQQILPVWPGRNLISAPLSSITRIDDWGLQSPPFDILSGPSAPRSDTLRLTYSDGSSSKVVYFRENHGWRSVGRPGDASNTTVEFSQAVDFQRAGPAGFVRFKGVIPPEPAALRTTAIATVPIQKVANTRDGPRLEWASEAGTTYQIQARAIGQLVWQDLGGPVVADGPLCHAIRHPEGHGTLRILVAP